MFGDEHAFTRAGVCVCVCERERERGGEGEHAVTCPQTMCVHRLGTRAGVRTCRFKGPGRGAGGKEEHKAAAGSHFIKDQGSRLRGLGITP